LLAQNLTNLLDGETGCGGDSIIGIAAICESPNGFLLLAVREKQKMVHPAIVSGVHDDDVPRIALYIPQGVRFSTAGRSSGGVFGVAADRGCTGGFSRQDRRHKWPGGGFKRHQHTALEMTDHVHGRRCHSRTF
jgi:hypothetical protein